MLFLAYLLLVIGTGLALAELFSVWRLCRYGAYNANMMFKAFLSFSLFPTRIILAIGVTLLVWVKFTWSWQFAVVALVSFFVVDLCLYFLQIPVVYSYRKKIEKMEKECEKTKVARQLGTLKDDGSVFSGDHEEGEITFIRYEDVPVQKRQQASVRGPSVS